MTSNAQGIREHSRMRTTMLVNVIKKALGGWSHLLAALFIISCSFAVPAYTEELTINRGFGRGSTPFKGNFTLSPPGSTYFSEGFQKNLPELGTLQTQRGLYHLYQNPSGTWLLCSNTSCGPVSSSSLPLVNRLLQDQSKLSPNGKMQDDKNKPIEEHSKKPLQHWCCKNKHEGERDRTCQEPHVKEDAQEGYKTVACGEKIDQQCPTSGNKDGEQPKPPVSPGGGGNPAPPQPPPPPGGGGGGGGGGGNPLGGMSQMLPALMQALAQKGQQGQQNQQAGQQQGQLSDSEIMDMARAAQTAIAQATAMAQATAGAQSTATAQQTSTVSSATSAQTGTGTNDTTTNSASSQAQVAATATSGLPANSTF